MSTAIYILDQKLNLIIHRQYSQDLNVSNIIESFKSCYQKSQPIAPPILTNNGLTFIYLKHDEIILMSPINGDINVMVQMEFLEKFIKLLKNYFKHYKLINQSKPFITTDLIKDNYILIYELFDECFDFGIPQLTDFSILKDYIKLMIKPENYYDESHFSEEINKVEKQVETEINSSITRSAMNKISWRPKGIFYNKNEFFINFNEFLKFKFNSKINKVITNQIFGEIKCKSYLSGMPNLKLGLNETLNLSKTIFNNIQYHQCVDLNSLNNNTIEFIPPDGEFDLLNYQILNTQILQPLILIKPYYRIYKKNDKFKLRLKIDMVTTFKRKFSMIDVKIRIPLIVKHKLLFINFNNSMKFKTKLGNVIHSLDDETIIWKIEKIQGSMRGEMLTEFELITEKQLFDNHLFNNERGRQERNDLFYFEIGSEFSKLGLNNHINNRISNIKNSKIDINNLEKIITVEFQLQNMLYSGLKVEFLTIKEDQLKLQTFPWIMYCIFCNNDDYSFVISDESFLLELDKSQQDELIKSGTWNKDDNENENKQSIANEQNIDNNNNTDLDDQKGPSNTDNLKTSKEDFSTALDHIRELKKIDKTKLDFEEYVVEDETAAPETAP